MTVAEDFLLLATDPRDGRCLLGGTAVVPALGGANLLDLIMAEKVELTGQKSKARVSLTNTELTGNPVIDGSIQVLQAKGPMRAQAAVKLLGKKAKETIYDDLVKQGEVRRVSSKAMGVFPLTRHPVIDTVRRDSLRQQIQASLMFELDATKRTGPLIGLLAASGKLQLVVDRPEVRKAKARAKVLAEGDWASDEVRKAIQAANTLLMMTVITATSAGSSSS